MTNNVYDAIADVIEELQTSGFDIIPDDGIYDKIRSMIVENGNSWGSRVSDENIRTVIRDIA